MYEILYDAKQLVPAKEPTSNRDMSIPYVGQRPPLGHFLEATLAPKPNPYILCMAYLPLLLWFQESM